MLPFFVCHIHAYQDASGTYQKIRSDFSSNIHEAKIMVVIGLKYTQLVAFTVPNLERHQFHVRKQIMEAKQPKTTGYLSPEVWQRPRKKGSPV